MKDSDEIQKHMIRVHQQQKIDEINIEKLEK